MRNVIKVRGARVHNLKNISLDIPRNALVVITGVSGSGKSSLAFDTLYAEGQRRYVESLSSYARQFLGMRDKPDVDRIDGLSPAIAIEQKAIIKNPRSTVGTVTELYDYLRLLFARCGELFCPRCARRVEAQTVEDVLLYCASLSPTDEVVIDEVVADEVVIGSPVVLHKKGTHEALFDRFIREGVHQFLVDGRLVQCHTCGPKLDKNKHHTIVAIIDRLGTSEAVLLESAIKRALDLAEGLVDVYRVDAHAGITLQQRMSVHCACVDCGIFFESLEPALFSFSSPLGACPHCFGLGEERFFDQGFYTKVCTVCGGKRLNEKARAVRVAGKNIVELSNLSIDDLLPFVQALAFQGGLEAVAKPLVRELMARLTFLKEVGLGYLAIARRMESLSGGEAQRVCLATQIGSALTGVMYVLDEPSIGLHQRDNERLLDMLKQLKALGNTVIVVEHDEETIRAADYVVDVGPQAGILGGTVVAAGTVAQVMACPESLTGQYLRGAKRVTQKSARERRVPKNFFSIIGAREHNLKNITVSIPCGLLSVVTGVSGSGKSTLINDVLARALTAELYGSKNHGGDHDRVEHDFENLVIVDQTPIGRTPRSNPATYVKVFDEIRALFACTREAQMRGYQEGRFSFNVPGGRCERCEGDGVICTEMYFLPDVYVTCESCRGRRFNRETLEILYRGKTIADVLAMTVDEAAVFFAAIPRVRKKLQTLQAVGLGYVQLGQSATTLSGGEAQRVKLSRELAKRSADRTLYILDEPTTGLHFDDIKKLLSTLDALVDKGATCVVIEHNLDVIVHADYVIDLGPEGGTGGGELVVCGTPERVADCAKSHTGRYVKQRLRTTGETCTKKRK